MTLNSKDNSRLHGYAGTARAKQTFSDADIAGALKEADSKQPGPLTRTRYQSYYENHSDKPHPYTIIRRHGKWSNALKQAGLISTPRYTYSPRISKEDCVRALIAARDVIGHLPSVGEYSELWRNGQRGISQPLKAKGYPSEATIRLKFGRWRDACAEAAMEIPNE